MFVLELRVRDLAATVAFVGSRRPLPPPFGRAENGLVAYEKGGDIFVVDPATGERRGVALGPQLDRYPRWSLDGTRLAFVRGPEDDEQLVVVDAAGTVEAMSSSRLARIDPDGIAWSPDGGTIALVADTGVQLFDTRSGRTTRPPIPHLGLEVHWRPPDGRELLFVGGPTRQPRLTRYSLDDGAVTDVPGTAVNVAVGDDFQIRPVGWTPDGRRFVFHRFGQRPAGPETIVVDVETGDKVLLDLAFGRLSNDGTRVVGVATDSEREWLCVAPIDGGPCQPIEGSSELIDRTGFASWQWAPDDSVIRSDLGRDGPAVLLDPNGGEPQRPSWAAEGAESWQRRAH
jgi:Tol biopolymer transport system component